MTTSRKVINSMKFLVLLMILGVCGSGCCSYYVLSECPKHFRNTHCVLERTVSMPEGRKTLAFEIVEETRRKYLPFRASVWKSVKRHSFEFPLDRAPKNVEVFDVFVKLNDSAKSPTINNLNVKSAAEGARLVSRPTTQFTVAQFELPEFEDNRITPSIPVNLTIQPSDLPLLTVPFFLKSYFKEHSRGSTTTFTRRRYDLMVPFQIDGNHIRVYSVSLNGSKYFFSDARTAIFDKTDINCATLAAWALFMPPALVIDIVTLPFQIGGVVLFCVGMSNLGP